MKNSGERKYIQTKKLKPLIMKETTVSPRLKETLHLFTIMVHIFSIVHSIWVDEGRRAAANPMLDTGVEAESVLDYTISLSSPHGYCPKIAPGLHCEPFYTI